MASILIHFTDADVPKTGLSATIDIYHAQSQLAVEADGAMTEVGDGWYYFNYKPSNSREKKLNGLFIWTCDGTASVTTASYRYQHGTFTV